MKKSMIFFAVLGLIIIGSLLFSMKDSVVMDRINPFLEIEEYYTTVDAEGKYLGKDSIREDKDSYQYEFTAYNASGKKQPITIKVTKQLREGAFLQILAKGQNGKSWMEVQENEIPEKTKEKL